MTNWSEYAAEYLALAIQFALEWLIADWLDKYAEWCPWLAANYTDRIIAGEELDISSLLRSYRFVSNDILNRIAND